MWRVYLTNTMCHENGFGQVMASRKTLRAAEHAALVKYCTRYGVDHGFTLERMLRDVRTAIVGRKSVPLVTSVSGDKRLCVEIYR